MGSQISNIDFDEIKRDKNGKAFSLFLVVFLCMLVVYMNYPEFMDLLTISVSSFLIYKWDIINKVFYIFFSSRSKNKVEFFIPFYKEDRGKSSYNMNKDGLLVKDNLPKRDNLTYTFYTSKKLDIQCKKYMLELLIFKDTFSDKNELTLFFTMSLFLVNMLYVMLMVSLYVNINHNIFSKEGMIIVTTYLFSMVIYFILSKMTPISKILIDYSKNEDLENMVILESKKGIVVEHSLSKIQNKFNKLNKSLNDRKAQILQVSTPIFYLAHITILLSYYIKENCG